MRNDAPISGGSLTRLENIENVESLKIFDLTPSLLSATAWVMVRVSMDCLQARGIPVAAIIVSIASCYFTVAAAA